MVKDFFEHGFPIAVEPDEISIKRTRHEHIVVRILASRLIEDGNGYYILIKGEPGARFYSA